MVPTAEEIKKLSDLLWMAVDEDGEVILESCATRTRRGFAHDLALYLLRAGLTVDADRPSHGATVHSKGAM